MGRKYHLKYCKVVRYLPKVPESCLGWIQAIVIWQIVARLVVVGQDVWGTNSLSAKHTIQEYPRSSSAFFSSYLLQFFSRAIFFIQLCFVLQKKKEFATCQSKNVSPDGDHRRFISARSNEHRRIRAGFRIWSKKSGASMKQDLPSAV